MTGSSPGYTLRVAASAARQMDRLPEKIAAAIVEFINAALVEQPRRVGHPLRRELEGLYSARRGAYRVIYEVDDATATVNVVRITHRADAYRPS